MGETEPDPHRFTVDQYHRMEEAGILADDDRVELVDGAIVEAPPVEGQHAVAVRRIADALATAAGERAAVRERTPVALGGQSEPEADVCVVLPGTSDSPDRPPRPADLLLLVEVCDTSVAFDDDVKSPLYAEAGVIETWLVDVAADVVIVARDPQRCGYMDKRRVTPGETIVPLMLPGAAVAVADLV